MPQPDRLADLILDGTNSVSANNRLLVETLPNSSSTPNMTTIRDWSNAGAVTSVRPVTDFDNVNMGSGDRGLEVLASPVLINPATGNRDLGRSVPGQTGVASVGNASAFNVETTTALGASATFTGAWRDMTGYNWLGAYAVSDQAFTLYTDEADASTPNVINQVSSVASAAAAARNNPTGQSARVAPVKTVLRWIRVVVVNGAAAQTRLNVQSTQSPLN